MGRIGLTATKWAKFRFPPPTPQMSEGEKKAEEEPELEMEISSPAYFHKDELPIKYTLDGEGISPPLVCVSTMILPCNSEAQNQLTLNQ